jgi:hypothetical protein
MRRAPCASTSSRTRDTLCALSRSRATTSPGRSSGARHCSTQGFKSSAVHRAVKHHRSANPIERQRCRYGDVVPPVLGDGIDRSLSGWGARVWDRVASRITGKLGAEGIRAVVLVPEEGEPDEEL